MSVLSGGQHRHITCQGGGIGIALWRQGVNTGADGQRFGGCGCVGTVPRQRSGSRREGQGFQAELVVLVYGRLKRACK